MFPPYYVDPLLEGQHYRAIPDGYMSTFMYLIAGLAVAFTGIGLLLTYVPSRHGNTTTNHGQNDGHMATAGEHTDLKTESRNSFFSDYASLLHNHDAMTISITIAVGLAMIALIAYGLRATAGAGGTQSVARATDALGSSKTTPKPPSVDL